MQSDRLFPPSVMWRVCGVGDSTRSTVSLRRLISWCTRRNTRLFLTDDGVAVQRTLSQQAKKVSAKAVAGLSGEECDQLRSLLQRVKINLAAE